MPVLRIIAGPDGRDVRCLECELGDPSGVDWRGRRVLLAERSSVLPPSRELIEARDRAADALAALGAQVETVPLRQLRRALELYLAVLSDGADVALAELIADSDAAGGIRGFVHALRGKGPHTPPLLITIAAEGLNKRLPQRRVRKALAAAQSLQREVSDLVGEGVMLHHPHARVAPKHNATVGRPWTITPTAIFNLLGTPVTQIPLGLNGRGLPLGVQVAAAAGNDHLTIEAALELERAFGGWVEP